MKRRGFLKLGVFGSLAALIAPRLAKASYIPEEPVNVIPGMRGIPYIVENSGMYDAAFRGPSYFERFPTVKVTGVWNSLGGAESGAHDCVVNESAYVELPKINGPASYPTYIQTADAYVSAFRPPDWYRIYVPLKGFEHTGPWYYLKTVSYRDAKRARFTIAVNYHDRDLRAELAPGDYERIMAPVNFPKPDLEGGQTHWHLYGGPDNTPIGIFKA